jgi:hypothetical protein
MAQGKASTKGKACSKRYIAEKRDQINKRRKEARHAKACAAKKANPPKVPRGTARAARRAKDPVVQARAQDLKQKAA